MDEASKPTPAEATQIPGTDTGPEVDLTGQTLGEYRILRRLGQGGMGQVYLAEQVSLKRKVALKVLKPELAANHISLQRFKQEAEAVARATHANIVQIYTISAAQGQNYMALEYVEGRNLREFLEKKGPPELGLGLNIMAQVGSALQRASELGIIHRDIKPENILLTRKGEVKVADFGLSRCFAEVGPAPHLTQSGITMGTPLYMSPEQVEGKPVDHRTDVYSFGVTCYHMFAGHPPFRGSTPLEVAYQHVHKEPTPLAEIRPDLPAELCAIIHKMMAKEPAARYQSGREIAREVGRLRDVLVAAGVTAHASPGASLSSEGLRSSSTQLRSAPPQRPAWWRSGFVAAGVALALAGGLVLGWWRAPRALDEPPEAPVEDAAAIKALFSASEREKKLQERVQEHFKPGSKLDLITGLKPAVDLGFLYLKERRLDDAERFFNEIGQPGRKLPAYHLLSKIGHAAVLAFKDEPAKSNALFLALTHDMEKFEKLPPAATLKPPVPRKENAALRFEEIEAYLLLWKNNYQVRELVARALTRNYQNDPRDFPAKLERYRQPPPPTLKTPP
jgi:eukaryotic-like serine/threonine-protein kinase